MGRVAASSALFSTTLVAFLEESHSGLVGATGNRVCDEHRGFESHLLRQNLASTATV